MIMRLLYHHLERATTRYLSPTTANLIATLEPAFTAVWAYFLLNEILTGAQLAGGALVLMGVILLRFGDR